MRATGVQLHFFLKPPIKQIIAVLEVKKISTGSKLNEITSTSTSGFQKSVPSANLLTENAFKRHRHCSRVTQGVEGAGGCCEAFSLFLSPLLRTSTRCTGACRKQRRVRRMAGERDTSARLTTAAPRRRAGMPESSAPSTRAPSERWCR